MQEKQLRISLFYKNNYIFLVAVNVQQDLMDHDASRHVMVLTELVMPYINLWNSVKTLKLV